MVRGPVSLAIVSVISLIMVGLTMGGPKVFENVLPESAYAWLDDFEMGGGMPSFGGSSFGGKKADSNDASARLEDNNDGWKADDDVTTLAGMHLAFVDQVIDGYSRRVKDAVPGAVEVLTEQAECAFTPPSDDAYVGLATVAERTPIGIATYSDADIAGSVQGLAIRFRTKGASKRLSVDPTPFEVADIAVTETEKPVYLIVDASNWFVVYNIHLAPDAILERIVLIGGVQAGVANVAPSVPVEVMTEETATACGFVPYEPLNPSHRYFEAVSSGDLSQEEVDKETAQRAQMERQWEKAFRKAFGVSPDGLSTGAVDGISLTTIGPVPSTPDARAVWKTMKGAPLRVTISQYLEKSDDPEGHRFADKVLAVATSFAWGDLANLEQGMDF